MENLEFGNFIAKNLKCTLVSYFRMDKETFDRCLNGVPAFTNCLLSAVDPESDRVQLTYFISRGCRFDKKALTELFWDKYTYEVIFFDVNVGEVPVFSVVDLQPMKIQMLELFIPFWSLLRFETIHSNFLKDYIVELTLEKMVIFILREIHSESPENFEKLNILFENERLIKVLSYIHENLEIDVSLDHMGSLVNLSGDYISQFVKRCLGESVQSYLIDQRVHNGLYYLATTDYSIYQIAEKTGFVDQAYFNRRFKKMFTNNPLKIRKNYRELLRHGIVLSGRTQEEVVDYLL